MFNKVVPPTCAVCFGDEQHGVEDLVLVLFVQDFALAEVGGELRRGDGAAQLVAFALHVLPQCLHLARSLHLLPAEKWKVCVSGPNNQKQSCFTFVYWVPEGFPELECWLLIVTSFLLESEEPHIYIHLCLHVVI